MSRTDPIPKWLSWLLLPLSWLYIIGLKVYLLPFRLGLRKRRKLSCRVVCVGNLTFGGTGKSPCVRAICEGLLSRGLRPAVLSRGHGGRLSRTGAIVSDGERRLLDATDSGDEPALLADALLGVPVAIGKCRYRAGLMLIEQFQPDIIVLDDGMQHWQLHRDVEIALVRADRPFGNGRVLPAGDLREPARGIKRADVVIITGGELVTTGEIEKLKGLIARMAPQSSVYVASKAVRAIDALESGETIEETGLKRRPVVAVSGIANPQSFEKMLAETGADIRDAIRFKDHCTYRDREIAIIEEAIERTGAEFVVTTAKDAVKLRLSNMCVLDINLIIENRDSLLDRAIGD